MSLSEELKEFIYSTLFSWQETSKRSRFEIDNIQVPFGKYKGKMFRDVPLRYLDETVSKFPDTLAIGTYHVQRCTLCGEVLQEFDLQELQPGSCAPAGLAAGRFYIYTFSRVFDSCADAVGQTLPWVSTSKSPCAGGDTGDFCGIESATITLG